MAVMSALLLQALLFVGALAAQQRTVPATQKVIGMLGDMQAKSKKEKQVEEVAYSEFKQWCSMESANLNKEITGNGAEMERLTAHIGKLSSDIIGLGEGIATLLNQVATQESDKQAATDQRAKDHASFLEQEKDFSESNDALDRAITILKKEDYDRDGAASLLQLTESGRLPERAQSVVAAFLGMITAADKQDPLGATDYKAPEAHGYGFQSGNIVEMLKRLQDQFRTKLGETQKAEMNSKHAYDMIEMDLTDSIDNKNKESEEKSAEKSRKTEEKAEAEKMLASETTLKASNEKTLASMTSECLEKDMSFQEKQQLRAEEIEAIGKAIEILSSPEVLGAAEQHLSLAQAPAKKGIALVQLRGGENAEGKTEGIRRRVRDFLEAKGKLLHSDRLTLLAEKMMADPFAKVKKMIDGMITRLLEEANGDADHEGFCDTEMGKSKIARTKLSEDIDGLSAAVEEGNSLILKLSDETAELTQEVQALDEAMAEATKLRVAEKAQNAATVADAKAAQKAVAAATAVLKDFYAKASTATAFIQLKADPRAWGLKTGVKMGTDEWNSLANPGFEGQVDTGHKENMQTFGETEEGQQDVAKYGVLSLLEIIASDFSTLQADTAAAEAAAAEAHERFAVESTKNKSVKMKKVELNEADQASAQAKLQADTVDMKATEDELLAADRYYEKLSPQCVDQGMTFEERTAARQAEIDSLKEALKLLQSEDIATTSL